MRQWKFQNIKIV